MLVMLRMSFLGLSHKSEVRSELSSDHIITAYNDCFTLVACILSMIAVHGSVPDLFRLSIIVPILKAARSICLTVQTCEGLF
jgi:hypothetical protein